MIASEKVHIILIFCCMSILTGCLYPKENMKQNAVPYEDQLQVVQKLLRHLRAK